MVALLLALTKVEELVPPACQTLAIEALW